MHQELFAVKWGLEQLSYYILGRRVKVVTDHANLKWLTSMAPHKRQKLQGGAGVCLSSTFSSSIDKGKEM